MRRFFSAILVLWLISAQSQAVNAASTQEARIWLKDLQRSEELVAAGLQTGDAAEIKRQSMALSRVLGRITDDLASLSLSDRMECAQAGQSLFNVTEDAALTPARAVAAAKSDLAAFHENMPKCERAITGRAAKRAIGR